MIPAMTNAPPAPSASSFPFAQGTFTAVSTIGVVGVADDFGTWFVSNLGNDAVAAQSEQTRYYWEGHYPRAEMTNYSTFGNADSTTVPADKRGAFFAITMTARKHAP